ncbi:MAG: N-acetyltransferase [Phycisphaerales bacterium]|nr:MAG: N-acetyltransferase [Phycisphaerales bacterium]
MGEPGFPSVWPIIETARLRLRPPSLDDAQGVQRFCNDPEVSRNAETIPLPYTVEHATEWIGLVLEEFEKGVGVGMLIEERASGEVIGDSCLKYDATHGRAEVGFVLGRDYRGNGYATEAARAMIGLAFGTLGVRKVMAVAFADNLASRRVLERCGMTLEASLRGHSMREGEPADDVMYGLLRREYDGGIRQ